MLERLRNKRLIIAGDSMNRNMWESLACLLYSSIPSSTVQVDAKNLEYKVLKAKVKKMHEFFLISTFVTKIANITNVNLRIQRDSENILYTTVLLH